MELKTWNWLDHLTSWIEKGLRIILILAVLIMACVLMLGVLSRYLLPTPIVGTDELGMFLLIWVTFLGASISIHRNDMVRVTVFVDRLGEFKIWLYFLVQVLILIFSVTFLVYGYKWVFSPSTLNNTSPSLQIPLWIVYLIFPLSMFTTALFAFRHIIAILIGQKSKMIDS